MWDKLKDNKMKIKITKCEAFGKHFDNLTPGSIHEVIDCPFLDEGEIEGVWVMGVGEPVKVLTNEYETVQWQELRRTTSQKQKRKFSLNSYKRDTRNWK